MLSYRQSHGCPAAIPAAHIPILMASPLSISFSVEAFVFCGDDGTFFSAGLFICTLLPTPQLRPRRLASFT